MAAIAFPSNPSDGQVFEAAGKRWQYSTARNTWSAVQSTVPQSVDASDISFPSGNAVLARPETGAGPGRPIAIGSGLTVADDELQVDVVSIAQGGTGGTTLGEAQDALGISDLLEGSAGNVLTSFYAVEAARAVVLKTTRTINGVPFNGSTNIQIPSNLQSPEPIGTLQISAGGTGADTALGARMAIEASSRASVVSSIPVSESRGTRNTYSVVIGGVVDTNGTSTVFVTVGAAAPIQISVPRLASQGASSFAESAVAALMASSAFTASCGAYNVSNTLVVYARGIGVTASFTISATVGLTFGTGVAGTADVAVVDGTAAEHVGKRLLVVTDGVFQSAWDCTSLSPITWVKVTSEIPAAETGATIKTKLGLDPSDTVLSAATHATEDGASLRTKLGVSAGATLATLDGTQTLTNKTLGAGTTIGTPGSLASLANATGLPIDRTTGVLPAAQLPNPTSTTKGGVKSNTGTAGQFVVGISSTGDLQYDTPGGTGVQSLTVGAPLVKAGTEADPAISLPEATPTVDGFMTKEQATKLALLPAEPGTVTSVGLSMPVNVFSVTGAPVTGSGTLSVSLNGQNARTFLAAGSTNGTTPTFRTIATADLPADVAALGQLIPNNLSYAKFISQTALGAPTYSTIDLSTGSVTNVLPINKGGTGGATAADARANLGLGSSSGVQFDSLNLTNALPVTSGGTGGSTAEEARASLGLEYASAKRMVVAESDFFSTDNLTMFPGLVAAPMASGTVQVPTSADNEHPGVLTFRNANSANSGYRVASSKTIQIAGGGEKFACVFTFNPGASGNVARLGWHDSSDHTTPSNGIWLNIAVVTGSATVTGILSISGTQTVTAADTIYSGGWYRLEIAVTGVSYLETINFKLFYNGNSAPSFDETIDVTSSYLSMSAAVAMVMEAFHTTAVSATNLLQLDYAAYSVDRALSR